MTTHPLSRRLFLSGGLAGTAAALAAPHALAASPARSPLAAAKPTPTDAQVYGAPTTNPLVWQRADPFVTHRTNGMYYFTGSVPEYDRLVVRGAPTIDGLGGAAESVVWRRPASGRMGGHIWAPELHQIDGRWYIYFAAGDSDDVFRIRPYVMESTFAYPRDPAGWKAPVRIATPWEGFSLDATTFQHAGRRYLVWASSEPEIAVNTSLYIAEMTSPFAITGDPVRITTPTLPWETQGYKVNEGPAVIIRNGRVFMIFSASATDSRYCMGLLTADSKADLLDWRSWSKSPEPVFSTWEPTSQYGPGHNSFTVAEDGVTDVLVYHARDYRDITGDPLYDPNRHARAQRLYWAPDGSPLFGVPVGKGGPIVRLSPADAASSYVRHYEYALRVDTDVTELADSQFRIVEGLGGVATVSICSVNYPDRYVTRVGDGFRIETAPDAGAASFLRRPGLARGNGVSFEIATAPGTYLTHGKGRLTIGPPAGSKSTFLLG